MSKSRKETARKEFKNLLEKEVKPAIQKVHLEKKTQAKGKIDGLVQLMVWVPEDLMVKIKTKTVLEKKSMKEIVTEILLENI